LVLRLERSAAALLRWSTWRRWHQAWARYHHYRRREEPQHLGASAQTSAALAHDTGGTVDAPSANKLIEVIWQRLQKLLPSGKRPGRPYSHDRRIIVEAIVHQRQTGCAWNALPSQFPPYQTVHTQLRNWQKTGIWAKVWKGLEQPCPSP
jgi:hypothetical protein